MSTIASVIDSAEKELKKANIEDARLESEFLVAAFLRMTRAKLYLERQKALTAEECMALSGWVKKRQGRMPLAYVSGEQPFRNLNLSVTPSVLVPRPETELLVEKCLESLDAMKHPKVAIDVGTGSGNIAISLASHKTLERVIAIDKSPAALEMAKLNAGREHTRITIEWVQSDLLSGMRTYETRADLIVANLPYVRSNDMKTLAPELHWEPAMALDGGHDGLRLIEPCIVEAAYYLKAGGAIFLEIGFDQADAVERILEREGAWINIETINDFSELPRIVRATRKG